LPPIKGSKYPRTVEVCAVGCTADALDQALKDLNAENWNIRQIYQEAPPYYRIFAQRELPVAEKEAADHNSD
jgi:hypothetical protein